MKRLLLCSVSSLSLLVGLAALPIAAQASTQQAELQVSDAEIDAYIKANIADPVKIAGAMEKYHVDLDRVQKATGYTREQIVDYIANSGNTQLKADLANWTPNKNLISGAKKAYVPTDAEVDAYIKANINDPALIAAAMEKHNVGLDRVQKATGYTRAQIADYVAQSGNAQLKTALGQWGADAETSTGGKTGQQVSGLDIDAYIKANINDPALIAAAMSKHGVTLDRVQQATGYTTEQISSYINQSGNPILQSALKTWKPAKDAGVSDVEIDAYIKANINDPAKIAAAMKQYNVSLDRIQRASGYTRQQMTDYIAQSNNSALKDAAGQWYVAKDDSTGAKADAKILGTDIDGYIRANLGDPAKIAAAMEKHNVSLDQIQKATGYTRAQMMDYINASNNPVLKAKLASWREPTAHEQENANINQHLRSILNDPNKIAEEMRKNNIGLDRIQEASGYTRAQMTDYINRSNSDYLKGLLASWKEPITIGLPARGEIKTLANGYTIDSNGKLYAPDSKLAIAMLTQQGQFVDVTGKPVTAAVAKQYIALFEDSAPILTGGGSGGGASVVTASVRPAVHYSQKNSYAAATDSGDFVAMESDGSVRETKGGSTSGSTTKAASSSDDISGGSGSGKTTLSTADNLSVYNPAADRAILERENKKTYANYIATFAESYAPMTEAQWTNEHQRILVVSQWRILTNDGEHVTPENYAKATELSAKIATLQNEQAGCGAGTHYVASIQACGPDFSATPTVKTPTQASVNGKRTMVANIDELYGSDLYKNADTQTKGDLVKFVNNALNDPKAANSLTAGGFQLDVGSHD